MDLLITIKVAKVSEKRGCQLSAGVNNLNDIEDRSESSEFFYEEDSSRFIFGHISRKKGPIFELTNSKSHTCSFKR